MQAAERLRRETGRAQADVSSSTVRLAIGQLLRGRYRIGLDTAVRLRDAGLRVYVCD